MRIRAACVLLLLPALAACGRAALHPAPGRAALAPAGALNAGGEPEWSVQLRAGALRFTSAEGANLSAQVSVEDHGKAGAVWTGPSAAAGDHPAPSLRLVVQAKACQDAATGMTYPLSATVEVAGRRYAGCAATPGQGLGPRT